MAVLDVLALLSVIGLLSTWILYPAAIGLIAALRRPRATGRPSARAPLSVVIASREPAEAVAERVRDVLRTDYPADLTEVVIARDRAAPDLDLTEFRNTGVPVRSVPADEPGGKAAALNAALRETRGELIVFADTHQRFARDTIPELIAPFSRPEVGAVTGHYSLARGSPPVVSMYWGFERWLRRCEARLHSSVGATGAVYALRRSLWQPLPAGLILDDLYVPMVVVLSGHRTVVADRAAALETRTPTPAQEYGRKVRTLTGVIQLCAWLPAVLVPIRNPIWLQFVFHKLARLLTPYLCVPPLIWLIVTAVRNWAPAVNVAIVLLSLGTGTWLAFSRGRIGTRLRRTVIEGALLQIAVLVAGFNGVRGRWQVWDA